MEEAVPVEIVEKAEKGLELFEEKATTKELPENVELMPSSGSDIMVFARTPDEMAKAQEALIAWADRKVAQKKEELKTAEKNFIEAREAKIRTAPWRTQMRKYEKEVTFYTKIREALGAGYFIVPDFPIDIIGVRTTATEPADTDGHKWQNNIAREDHQQLPVGEGEYVDPVPKAYKYQNAIVKDGKETTETLWTADGTELQKMDFPFRMIKPHLLKDLSKAAKLKIFDAIGVLPNRRRAPDPMLLGVIENKVGRFSSKRVLFLISWWIPTADL